MRRRSGVVAALLFLALLCGGFGADAARHSTPSLNPANDALLKLSPAQRAAKLALAVGHWCIGTDTFLMGVTKDGPGKGNAYWSLRCTDGSTWAIQVDPLAEVTAIDCATFAANAVGKACFKKF